MPSTGFRAYTKIAVRWFGVFVTAFTIFSNAQAFVDFSNFISGLTEQWRDIVAGAVNSLLALLHVELPVPDAVLVFSVISCIIVASTSQVNVSTNWSLVFKAVGWVITSIFSALYFVFIALSSRSTDPRFGDETATYLLISLVVSAIALSPVYFQKMPKKNIVRNSIGLVGFIFALIATITITVYYYENDAPDLPDIVEYLALILVAAVVVFMVYVSDPIEISKRSFSIGLIVAGLFAINIISKILEDSEIFV